MVAIEADLEASPWEGEGYRKVWARLRVCRDIRVARKRVLRLMRENNLLSPHRCRRRGGNPHDGEIITHAPNLMSMAFGCSRWTTAGAGSSPPSSIGTPSVSAGMSATRRPLRRPAADLQLDRGRRGSGAGRADGSRLRSSSGASSRPTPSCPRAVQSHAEGTDHPWSRNIAELRDAVRDFVELYAQWIVEKNYLSPAQARWHAATVRQTCEARSRKPTLSKRHRMEALGLARTWPGYWEAPARSRRCSRGRGRYH